MKAFWNKLQAEPIATITTQNLPAFDISSAYNKLYEANGEKEVTLTAYEADELLDYIQYIAWLTNPPKDTEWYQIIKARENEQYRKF
jgi:hypothetical protein